MKGNVLHEHKLVRILQRPPFNTEMSFNYLSISTKGDYIFILPFTLLEISAINKQKSAGGIECRNFGSAMRNLFLTMGSLIAKSREAKRRNSVVVWVTVCRWRCRGVSAIMDWKSRVFVSTIYEILWGNRTEVALEKWKNVLRTVQLSTHQCFGMS